MANSFLDLPMPAGDGAGASVDTSAMGKGKTIVVGGSFKGVLITIQVSTDGGTVFQQLTSFTGPGKKTIDVAAEFMRVWISGRSAEAFSANADVGANDIGGTFIDLLVPAGDGVSAPVDVSALGSFTTIVAGGEFRDCGVIVEVSEDGVSYASCASFRDYGAQVSKELIANFARVSVSGREGNTFPYSPTVSMGATNDAASGGVGATGQSFINVLDFGEGASHDSDTPLVVGQRGFNPLDYNLNNATRTLEFRAVASNGGGAALTKVQLWGLTDSEAIATIDFTTAIPTQKSVVLVEGSGSGEIDLSNKVYEVRIWVDTPDLVDDTIELGSAEINIASTID